MHFPKIQEFYNQQRLSQSLIRLLQGQGWCQEPIWTPIGLLTVAVHPALM